MSPNTPTEEQLKRARRVLDHLEAQAAGYTALTIPAHLVIELEEQRKKVAELEGQVVAPPPPLSDTADRARLRKNLVDYFSLDELRTLCFDLGIPYEEFPTTKSPMAQSIVEYCGHTGNLDPLVAECRRLRPHVEW